MNNQKEIEYSFEVSDLKPSIKYLKSIGAHKTEELKIQRDIYKNGSSHFIKISKENNGGNDKFIFSLKEDLMAKGKSTGLKVSDEVDIEVSEEQINKLVSVIELLNFKKDTSFKKSRISFIKGKLKIDLDTYYFEEGNKYYVEVEGENKAAITKFANEMKSLLDN